MEILIQPLIGLLTGLVIAFASSWITVQLSLRRFYSARWWERKAEAYSKIVESLSHMKNYTDRTLNAYYRGNEIPADLQKTLQAKRRDGFEEISKAADMGAFIISEEAVNLLRNFINRPSEIDEESDWTDYTEKELKAVNECLATIRGIAKRDLEVR